MDHPKKHLEDSCGGVDSSSSTCSSENTQQAAKIERETESGDIECQDIESESVVADEPNFIPATASGTMLSLAECQAGIHELFAAMMKLQTDSDAQVVGGTEVPQDAVPSPTHSAILSSETYEDISEDLLDFVKKLDADNFAADEKDFAQLQSQNESRNWPILAASTPLPVLDHTPMEVPDHPLTYEEIVNQPGFTLESLTYLNIPDYKTRMANAETEAAAHLKKYNKLPGLSPINRQTTGGTGNQGRRGFSQRQTRKNKLTKFCNFCKSNGETSEFYSKHQLKNAQGIVTCPILRKVTCTICNSCGDAAHTIKYCPELMVQQQELAQIGWDLPGGNLYKVRKNARGVSKNVLKYF